MTGSKRKASREVSQVWDQARKIRGETREEGRRTEGGNRSSIPEISS